jgi:hypothetical protein
MSLSVDLRESKLGSLSLAAKRSGGGGKRMGVGARAKRSGS